MIQPQDHTGTSDIIEDPAASVQNRGRNVHLISFLLFPIKRLLANIIMEFGDNAASLCMLYYFYLKVHCNQNLCFSNWNLSNAL